MVSWIPILWIGSNIFKWTGLVIENSGTPYLSLLLFEIKALCIFLRVRHWALHDVLFEVEHTY